MEFYDFPYIGNVIIPTDELIFFQRGRSTTNQRYNPPGSDVPPGNDFAVTRVRVVLKQREQGSVAENVIDHRLVHGLEHFLFSTIVGMMIQSD